MESDKPGNNTATGVIVSLEDARDNSDLRPSLAIVANNHRPILGTFSDDETLALGTMMDRLDGLERAVRVRPNAKAIAALRESVEIDMAIAGGDANSRLVAHATAVLLEMLDKIMAVPA